jgi:hypothetical protein
MIGQKSTNKGDDSQGNTAGASCLDSCVPSTIPDAADTRATRPVIRRFQQDEPFTRVVTEPITIACLIDRKEDNGGFYAGEDYYPVPAQFQNQARRFLRNLAFHACVTAYGEWFILAQKLDLPHSRPNSWNESLAKALGEPVGQWLKVWSDSPAQRYQYELVQPQMEGTPEYPDFAEDLEKSLVPNIIDTLNHPVLQRLLDDRAGRNNSDEVY